MKLICLSPSYLMSNPCDIKHCSDIARHFVPLIDSTESESFKSESRDPPASAPASFCGIVLLLFAGIYIHRGGASPPPLQTISDEGTSLFHRFFRFWHRRGRDGRWKISLKKIAAPTIRIRQGGNWEREPRVSLLYEKCEHAPYFSESVLYSRLDEAAWANTHTRVQVYRFKYEWE